MKMGKDTFNKMEKKIKALVAYYNKNKANSLDLSLSDLWACFYQVKELTVYGDSHPFVALNASNNGGHRLFKQDELYGRLFDGLNDSHIETALKLIKL